MSVKEKTMDIVQLSLTLIGAFFVGLIAGNIVVIFLERMKGK